VFASGAAQAKSLELAAEQLGQWMQRVLPGSAPAVPVSLLVVWSACSCRCLRRVGMLTE